jgi:hypothetical protein
MLNNSSYLIQITLSWIWEHPANSYKILDNGHCKITYNTKWPMWSTLLKSYLITLRLHVFVQMDLTFFHCNIVLLEKFCDLLLSIQYDILTITLHSSLMCQNRIANQYRYGCIYGKINQSHVRRIRTYLYVLYAWHFSCRL